MTQQVSRADVVPAHPNPIILGLRASSSENLGSPRTLLVLSCSEPAFTQCLTNQHFAHHSASHTQLHRPLLLGGDVICFSRYTSAFLLPEIFFFHLPVYLAEGLGCHHLEPVWSDLHPLSSRVLPASSLCALPTERTAVSSTPSAP